MTSSANPRTRRRHRRRHRRTRDGGAARPPTGTTVTLFEARDDVGGRAGIVGARRLPLRHRPELVPHARGLRPLLPAARHERRARARPRARSTRLPGLLRRRRVRSRSTSRLGRDAATALFEASSPAPGARLDAYLDSAADAYDLAVTRFLYDTYEPTAGLRDPALLRRLPQLAPLLTRRSPRTSRAGSPTRGCGRSSGYPAVFLGGSPFGVPSLYHLMSHLDLDDGVLYPRGGFTEVIRAIERLALAAASHRDERRCGSRRRMRGTSSSTTGRRARPASALADGRRIAADLVVSAADLHHTETELLPRELQTYPEAWWASTHPEPGRRARHARRAGRAAPARAPHAAVHRGLARRTSTTSSARRRRIPDPASFYVCRPSATDPTVAPAGHENLFVLVPVPADPALGRGGIDGDGDAARRGGRRPRDRPDRAWCGIPDLAERVVVRRTVGPGDFAADLHSWRGNALGLAHTLRQSAFFRPRNASRQGRRPALRGRVRASRASACRCASSRPSSCSSACAATASPGPLPEPVARGVTAGALPRARSSSSAAGIAAARRALAARLVAGARAHGRGGRASARRSSSRGTPPASRRRLREGRQSALHRHRPRAGAAARGAGLPGLPLLSRARRVGGGASGS